MTSRIEALDARTLHEAARQALAASSDGLDVSAVQPETPLAAVIFDSLAAVRFIATLEADLGIDDVPFEGWLAEHSERTDALTFGSLVDWLQSLPQIGSGTAGARARASGGRPEDG